MAVTTQDLRDACNRLRDHLKGGQTGAQQFQELQMMAYYGEYYIAANYRHESDFIPTDAVALNEVIGMANKITSVGTASSPAVAAAKSVQNKLWIVAGPSTTDSVVHAEQTLLLVLAHKLKNRIDSKLYAVPNVKIGGCKTPCSKCFSVLTAFSDAYAEVYGKTIEFETDRTGAYGTNGDPKIKKIGLAEEFPDAGGLLFGDFVARYGGAIG